MTLWGYRRDSDGPAGSTNLRAASARNKVIRMRNRPFAMFAGSANAISPRAPMSDARTEKNIAVRYDIVFPSSTPLIAMHDCTKTELRLTPKAEARNGQRKNFVRRPAKRTKRTFEPTVGRTVLAQREMENRRSTLAQIPPRRGVDFQGNVGLSFDGFFLAMQRARERVPRC